MSNFLRGGQVTAHKFRMTMQVVRIIMRITLGIMLFTVFITFKNNIEAYQWKMIPAILKRYTFAFAPEKIVTYRNKWGLEVREKIKHLPWNKDFNYTEKRYEEVFYLSGYRVLWVLGFSIILSIFYFIYRGRILNENQNIRGSFLVLDKGLKRSIKKYNRQFKNYYPYELAGIPYAATGKKNSYTSGEQAHTLIMGTTGSGKTRIIQDLVRQFNYNNEKAVIVDIKGDYISHFYNQDRGDIILNPLDKRGANWSFFEETDDLRGFDTIARTLMPDTRGDPFWVNAARTVFSELATISKGIIPTVGAFATAVLKSDTKMIEKYLKNTAAAKLINQDADKTVACVLMMLSVYLAPFRLYKKEGNIFSISNWINDPKAKNILFISTSPDMKGSLNPLVQLQVDIAITAMCSSKNSHHNRTWFVLDELGYFDQAIPNLKDGLTMSRSFGGAFILGVQDLASLSKIYGHDLSRVLANNCRNKMIMNIDDTYTAKWCSDLFGEGELVEWNEGLSYGSHEMRDGVNSQKISRMKRAILPSEFSKLNTGSGYIKMPGFNPSLVNFKGTNIPQEAAAFVENTDIRQAFQQDLVRVENTKAKVEETISKGFELSEDQIAEDVLEDHDISTNNTRGNRGYI
jgi:type IV conjugative transfer system coupling protein TraD